MNLIYPLNTEKSYKLKNSSVYIFYVSKKENKKSVKEFVEKKFNIKVASVNVLNTNGKSRRFRGNIGYRQDKKKVYIKLMPGHTMNFGENENNNV